MTDRVLNTGSHDLPVSDQLTAFMKQGWADTEQRDLTLLTSAIEAAKRRELLSTRYPGVRLVIPAGTFKVRSNDTDFRFRPHSAFAWLTGIPGAEAVPDTALVFEPRPSGGHDCLLFLHPRSSRETDEFFRDRRHGEFWVGRRPTLAETQLRYGLEAREIYDLAALVSDGAPTLAVRGEDLAIDQHLPESDEKAEATLLATLSEMRLVKDAWEINEMQAAVDATIRGFEDVVRAIPQAVKEVRGERVIESAFLARARLEGNDVGYDTIAASGSHACVLHWIRNDGAVKEGELLLLDAGVEVDSLYTADITRTLPISGRFTEAQRKVYLLVYQAQEAAIAAVKPGARFRDFHLAAMKTIAEGLEEWGILPVSAAESMSADCGLHRRWTLCSSGHMLGIDVHDCAKARSDQYLDGVLEVGHVLTVEPGLYLQPDDLLIPEEFRGIGVRIEDDLVVTETGSRLLSGALPRHPDDVEAWMATLR
jgi:Xaa-Pro aminopeptidase